MMVSVCMITYGHEKFIKQAIEGVLMQQCDFEVELIIANDCSPDNTDNVVKEILQTDKRASWINYTRQERNLGVTANLLFALQKCKGNYIAFCEGDDYWTAPLKLQKQRDYFLSNPGIGLVYTDYNIFMQNTGQLTAPSGRGRIPGVNAVYNDLIKNNFIAMLTVMADSKILLEASQKLRLAEHNWSMADYPLWLYIASSSKIAYLPECMATYRYLPVSASHTGSLKKNLSFLKSVFLIRLYFHQHIKKISIKNLFTIYRIFYHESYLYIYRKFKQKIMIERLIERLIEKINPTYNAKFSGTEFEANNWKLSAFILRKIVPVVGTHPFPLNELLLMTAAVACTKPTHIFEWGTHIGKSARIFYETCRFLKIDTVIHSIDLPDEVEHAEHPHQTRGKLVKGKKNVLLHQGDGVDTALKIYESLAEEVRPLFYLDGDHSYATVYRELVSIIEKVNKPAIILHDTFYQTEESGYNIGPFKAIEDVLLKFAYIKFKRIDTNTGLPGMTFLFAS